MLDRPLSRVWSAFVDLGYSRNDRLQTLSAAQQATCAYNGQANPNNLPLCPGVNADTYNYGFAGAGLHRAFGRDFHGFVSYQFNELSFDQSYCMPNDAMQPHFEPECVDVWIGLDSPADPD